MKWQGSSQNNSIHKFVPKEHMPRYSFVFIEHTERSSRALYDIIVTLLWLNIQFAQNFASSTSWEENTCLKIGLRNYVNKANYWKSVEKNTIDYSGYHLRFVASWNQQALFYVKSSMTWYVHTKFHCFL